MKAHENASDSSSVRKKLPAGNRRPLRHPPTTLRTWFDAISGAAKHPRNFIPAALPAKRSRGGSQSRPANLRSAIHRRGRSPREKRQMLQTKNQGDCFGRPLEPLEKPPMQDGNRPRKPSALRKKIADRTMIVFVQCAARAYDSPTVAGTSARLGRTRATFESLATVIVARIGLMTARIVPLSRQRVQSLAHRRNEAIQDGQRPGESDSPGFAHEQSPPKGSLPLSSPTYLYPLKFGKTSTMTDWLPRSCPADFPEILAFGPSP